MKDKNKCISCGQKLKMFNRIEIPKDGTYICNDCFDKLTDKMKKTLYTLTFNDIKSRLDEMHSFSKQIEGVLLINEEQKIWSTPELLYQDNPVFFNYDDIVGFEYLENGNSTTQKGGVGRAVTGGLLFGGAGAIVGSVTGSKSTANTISSMRIKISVKNDDYPLVLIDILKDGSIRPESSIYSEKLKTVERIFRELEKITNVVTQEHKSTEMTADEQIEEVRKFKQLYEEGILTEEEFTAKKKKILGI